MFRYIIIFTGAVLTVSCTTATLHQKSGRFDGSYSLHVDRYTGPADSVAMYNEIHAGFTKQGIQIDSMSPRRITCSCDLSYERKDYVLIASSSYIASIRCRAGDAEFQSVGYRTLPERFFTTAAAIGILAENSLPWYAIAGGVAIDLVLVPSSAGAYEDAVEVALRRGLDPQRMPTKSASTRK